MTRLGGGRVAAVAASLLATAALGATTSAPTVDRIVSSYVSARGGMEKLRAVVTLRQKGRVTAGANRGALVSRELQRPSRTRFEFTVQGMTGVYVSDGARGWQVSPFDGDMEVRPLSDDAVSEAAEQADLDGPLVDWRAKGHRVQLVGRETVGGRETYKLEVALASGAVLFDYIDVRTSRLVRTDSTRHVRGRPVQIRTTFGDFRKSDGVLFPRRIEVEAEGRPDRLVIRVESVEVNPSLGDARFSMPAPATP